MLFPPFNALHGTTCRRYPFARSERVALPASSQERAVEIDDAVGSDGLSNDIIIIDDGSQAVVANATDYVSSDMIGHCCCPSDSRPITHRFNHSLSQSRQAQCHF